MEKLQTFKITNHAVDDAQEVTFFYDDFRPSEQYPGTYSTQIIHQGEKKWINLSQYVVDKIRELGIKKEEPCYLVRRINPKNGRTFIDVLVKKNDITNQFQNVKPTKYFNKNEVIKELAQNLLPKTSPVDLGSMQTKKVAKDAVEDQRCVPEHFYAQDGDSVSERIIRGMCWNAAYTLLASGAYKGKVIDVAKSLFVEGAKWLRNGDS